MEKLPFNLRPNVKWVMSLACHMLKIYNSSFLHSDDFSSNTNKNITYEHYIPSVSHESMLCHREKRAHSILKKERKHPSTGKLGHGRHLFSDCKWYRDLVLKFKIDLRIWLMIIRLMKPSFFIFISNLYLQNIFQMQIISKTNSFCATMKNIWKHFINYLWITISEYRLIDYRNILKGTYIFNFFLLLHSW